MKKQYKLYYNETHTDTKPFKFKEGMFIWSGEINRSSIRRIDVCTCDNIYTARVLRDIIHDSLKQDVQIEEVEVNDYE